MLKWGWDTKITELVNLTRFGCRALGSSCGKDKISSFLKNLSLDNVDTVLTKFNDIIETGCSLALRKTSKF